MRGCALMLGGVLVIAGCASSRAEQAGDPLPPGGERVKLVDDSRPDLATQKDFDARAEARRFDHAADCDAEARDIQRRNPTRGWKLLRACVARGDFTDLRALLDGPWDHALRTQPDAAALVAQLIAVRGGDIDTDVGLLHQHKVPVFTLSDAIAQPEVYAGRLLVMRARVADLRKRGNQVTVALHEYAHSSGTVYAAVGPGHQHTRNINHQGRAGGVSAHDHVQTVSRHNRVEQRMVTDDSETGLEALGKLPKMDPFLEPDKDFILLVRFDGMRHRAAATDGPSSMPEVTVLSYFKPGALPLY